MKRFMDEDFLLSTETAKRLYHTYAETMPVLDYHCHLNPEDIYKNKKFENITGLWLGEDHYKWRLMRANGIDEKYITGSAPDEEKFQKWAETLELAVGNPLYHWSHLELKRYFGYHGYLNGENAKEVWQFCNEKLNTSDMGARSFILRSKVRLLCTTDDPADSLEWHKKIAEDASFGVQVLPAWRPDRAINLEKPDYSEYLLKLGEAAKMEIHSFSDFIKALQKRMNFFEEMGCCISDHGLEYLMYVPASMETVENIFARRKKGEAVTREEEMQFKTMCMTCLGKEYHRRGWVMQLHCGVIRNVNQNIFEKLGADSGIDCINNFLPFSEAAAYLNKLAETDELPRTIFYSLNPADNAAIQALIGCFQDSEAVGKLQQGCAWWFNDHKTGITEQMISVANLGILGNFIGMLTDSRSFLSYARHEYFRRILCELIGSWVENGEYPENEKALERIVKGISYQNAVRYFGFHIV